MSVTGVAVRLVPTRWWHIAGLLRLEETLFGSERWSAAMFWSELAQHETRWYRTALDPDDEIVGYVGLCVYGQGADAEAWVQTLAVRPDAQRRGVGGALLDALLGEADRRGAGVVALEVRADNVAAQRLYARRGFESVGVRRGYYQPSGVDAVVMARPAPPLPSTSDSP